MAIEEHLAPNNRDMIVLVLCEIQLQTGDCSADLEHVRLVQIQEEDEAYMISFRFEMYCSHSSREDSLPSARHTGTWSGR